MIIMSSTQPWHFNTHIIVITTTTSLLQPLYYRGHGVGVTAITSWWLLILTLTSYMMMSESWHPHQSFHHCRDMIITAVTSPLLLKPWHHLHSCQRGANAAKAAKAAASWWNKMLLLGLPKVSAHQWWGHIQRGGQVNTFPEAQEKSLTITPTHIYWRRDGRHWWCPGPKEALTWINLDYPEETDRQEKETAATYWSHSLLAKLLMFKWLHNYQLTELN